MKVAAIAISCLLGSASAFAPMAKPAMKSTKLFDGSMIGDLPQEALLAAGAVAVAGLAGIFAGGGGDSSSSSSAPANKEPEPEPVDVSIPYNAAAMIEFKKVKGSVSFSEFEALYVQKVVADVSAKKVKRDVEATVKQAELDASKAAAEFEKKFG